MKPKILMIGASITQGILGVGLTFLPKEISKYFGIVDNRTSLLMFQILGSIYLSFSILNRMTKNNLIGGIYSRPLVTANLIHFLVSSFALYKIVAVLEYPLDIIIISTTIIYSVLTLGFGYVFMVNPKQIGKA